MDPDEKMDPYEQKLKSLFRSHSSGEQITQSELQALCVTLQLQKAPFLVHLLLENKQSCSFIEFRRGLLQVINEESSGGPQATTQVAPTNPAVQSDVEASDREISPKFVVGTKKYGRRSRPQDSEDLLEDTSDSDNETAVVPNMEEQSNKVHRSASQSDMHGSKRKRSAMGSKLKRCASLPSHKSRNDIKLRQQLSTSKEDDEEKLKKGLSLQQNLQDVWNSFSSDDFILLSQLEVVCEKMGLHQMAAKLAAEEIFEKLKIEKSDGISFEAFMNLLQSDSEMFSSVENIGQIVQQSESTPSTPNETIAVFQPSKIDFSPDSGSVTSEMLQDLWERAGVCNADKLLNNLGFYGKTVQVLELNNVLEEEIQRSHDDDSEVASLLKASLALHKAEITSIRQLFRQVVDENRKLFTDNKEANRRASILAHEIDQRHMDLEDSTKSEIRILEHRHSEQVKELTAHLTNEHEKLSALNAKLELRIKVLEVEEMKLKNDVTSLQNENNTLDSEQNELHRQITEMLEQNIKLNQEISDLQDNQDYKEDHNEEVLDLIEKIEALQMENSNLRDKNDEFSTDIEQLQMDLARSKITKKPLLKPEVDEEMSSSAAIKRRGDSPSKARTVEESPRMGKVRKFSNDIDESDQSGDWIALNSELGQVVSTSLGTSALPFAYNEEEVLLLKKKLIELEDQLAKFEEKNGKTIPSSSTATDSSTHVKSDDPKSLVKIHTENQKLVVRCSELETSLEQMSKEYENCEDYWQSKVNDERVLFDEEQRISDEKFAELLQKMVELEEQFSNQNEKNGRLTPIEEKCHLEQQYEELENEMEDLKVHAGRLLDEKDKEVNDLKEKIVKLKEISCVTPQRAQSPGNESVASSPINYLWNQSTITGPARDYQNPNYIKKTEPRVEDQLSSIPPIQKPSSVNGQAAQPQPEQSEQEKQESKDMLDLCEALSVISGKSVESNSVHSMQELQRSFSSSPITASVAKENVQKFKTLMVHMKEEIKELSLQRESLIMELQQLQEAKPILAKAYVRTNHPNLGQKVQNLEQKNRHLQAVLKQQQQYAESIMHQTWQQQRAELNELRNRLEAQSIVISEQAQRLASADLLVKDLYVENTQLVAANQRMEQQMTRHTLMQIAQHHQQQQYSSMGSMGSVSGGL